jgi:peptidoglycan hydrolase-like protein with peptidoglycan-binding domain
MALQSKLFRGDPKLEACLVNDTAHVLQGTRGEHVSKLQKALNALGDQAISPDEIGSKTYGPSTASAVLSYKKKRNIINFSYQTQADNIVGKMTIASLDKEMQQLEKPPVVTSVCCRWNQTRLG